jgi:hypothetical protein
MIKTSNILKFIWYQISDTQVHSKLKWKIDYNLILLSFRRKIFFDINIPHTTFSNVHFCTKYTDIRNICPVWWDYELINWLDCVVIGIPKSFMCIIAMYLDSYFLILYFHVNYLILIGWESLDKIYCRPLIDETTPKSVQKHNNGPHCMTTVNILKNIDCANFMRVRFAVDCKTTSFERL